ncbi:MAG: transporter substrate-binding domain-containing protein [Clostridia bacterium]|nr:transporter substrate-binding domain-containing protein [Clostridia bacterium]
MKKKIIITVLTVLLLSILSVTAFAFTTGDVTEDGKLTAADARLALRYSAKLETLTDEQIKAADVDESGKVTASDARKILRVSAKLDPPFEKINIDEYLIEDGVLSVAVEDNRYPFSYIENGELKGYNIELFKRIEEFYEVEVKFYPVKYFHMVDEIDNGKYDVAVYSETVVFGGTHELSEVFYSNKQNAVVSSFISTIDEIKNMPGIKIGVIKNSLAEKILLKDKELGVLKADAVKGFDTCLEGKKAVENGEIKAFITDLQSANYMDADNDGVYVSQRYNYENYLFFTASGKGELVELLERVVNNEQAEKIVDKYCHYEVDSKIVASAYSVDIAPGGSAIIKLKTESFYSPVRLDISADMECPYDVMLREVKYQMYDEYYLQISVPFDAKSDYVTVVTSLFPSPSIENLQVKIKVNVTSSADSNYHIAGKTDIPDFGAMTKTNPEILINGSENIFFTYNAYELDKNGVTISQARKYYDKLRTNGFVFTRGYSDGYRIYKNKATGEDVIYREYYTPTGKLEKIVIECMFIKYLD